MVEKTAWKRIMRQEGDERGTMRSSAQLSPKHVSVGTSPGWGMQRATDVPWGTDAPAAAWGRYKGGGTQRGELAATE